MPLFNFNKVDVILYESPISRAYLKIILEENINIENYIYLNSKNFLPNKIKSYLLFKKNNFYALKFLKDKNILKLVKAFEEFFSLKKNFCIDMYKFSNSELDERITYISNESINSEQVLKKLLDKKFNNRFILNTGKEILKDILNVKSNFFHIHPGYLPDVRGADGSLNSILYDNCIGVTSFIMGNKIDQGQIILREKYNYPKFKFDNFHNYDLKDIYRIWYSFFDPLLRASHLIKLYNLKDVLIDNASETNKGNYYSFLKANDLKKVFNKIFS